MIEPEWSLPLLRSMVEDHWIEAGIYRSCEDLYEAAHEFACSCEHRTAEQVDLFSILASAGSEIEDGLIEPSTDWRDVLAQTVAYMAADYYHDTLQDWSDHPAERYYLYHRYDIDATEDVCDIDGTGRRLDQLQVFFCEEENQYYLATDKDQLLDRAEEPDLVYTQIEEKKENQ